MRLITLPVVYNEQYLEQLRGQLLNQLNFLLQFQGNLLNNHSRFLHLGLAFLHLLLAFDLRQLHLKTLDTRLTIFLLLILAPC